jgi:flagellar basal-body rod protein FlgC
MDLEKALQISSSGMQAQTKRLRVIAENLANQDTAGSTPGATPYRRKTVTFADQIDRASGVAEVAVKKIGTDPSAFPQRYDPSHPAANANSFVEVMDMREAERSYSANLQVMQVTRGLLTRAIGMLK